MVAIENTCTNCFESLNCGARVQRDDLPTVLMRVLCGMSDTLDSALIILEDIAVSASPAVQTTPLFAVVDYLALTNAYVAAITDAHHKLGAKIDNETNDWVSVSFDGINEHERISPSSAVVYDWAREGQYEARSIYLKYTSSAPLAGNVIVSARY